MKQSDRFLRAEKFLLEVENQFKLSQSTEAMIAMQLAGIYEHDRSVAYLACLLSANTLGMAIPDMLIVAPTDSSVVTRGVEI